VAPLALLASASGVAEVSKRQFRLPGSLCCVGTIFFLQGGGREYLYGPRVTETELLTGVKDRHVAVPRVRATHAAAARLYGVWGRREQAVVRRTNNPGTSELSAHHELQCYCRARVP